MNAITMLEFEDIGVRSVEIDGAPWFVGKDVCRCLQMEKHHQALDRLEADERGTYTIGTPGGDQEMIVISEAHQSPAIEYVRCWQP